MPGFQTEAEEAAWWFGNQDRIALEAFQAIDREILIEDREDAESGKARAAAHGMS